MEHSAEDRHSARQHDQLRARRGRATAWRDEHLSPPRLETAIVCPTLVPQLVVFNT